MYEKLVFYTRWKKDNPVEWGDWQFLWTTNQFQLKIITETIPEQVMTPHNPCIHWVVEEEFTTIKNNSKSLFVEIPTPYYVPTKSKNFDKITIPETFGVYILIVDHQWMYYTRDDTKTENVARLTLDDLYIENHLNNEEKWFNDHLTPTWETLFNKGEDNLTLLEKRMLVGISNILGEWNTIETYSSKCEWSSSIQSYDNAMISYRMCCHMPQNHRENILFTMLVKSGGWIETWWQLIKLYDQNKENMDKTHLYLLLLKKTHDKYYGSTPSWYNTLPLGRWIKTECIKESELYHREFKLFEDEYFKSLTKYRMNYLFSHILFSNNQATRHIFTQGCLGFFTNLSKIAECEKQDLLYSDFDNDYVPSSSGLIVYPENPQWYVVNVRRVNYRILPNGAYVTIKNGNINSCYNGISKNEYYLMDRDTLLPVSPVRQMNEEIPNQRPDEIAIVGLEDIRLVPGPNQEITFYGVTKSYSYSGAIRIITGKYDISRAVFCDAKVARPPYEENSCEKNWTWCGHNRYIYRWHPIEIGSLDDNNKLVVDERINSPEYFNEFRGSSPPVVWRGFHFFTVHSVAFGENGRKYVHYVVVLDLNSKNKRTIGVTSPFCFEDIQIEYTIGLDIHKGKMLFLYSTRDSTSRSIRVPLTNILENLYFEDEQAETCFKTKIYQDVF